MGQSIAILVYILVSRDLSSNHYQKLIPVRELLRRLLSSTTELILWCSNIKMHTERKL